VQNVKKVFLDKKQTPSASSHRAPEQLKSDKRTLLKFLVLLLAFGFLGLGVDVSVLVIVGSQALFRRVRSGDGGCRGSVAMITTTSERHSACAEHSYRGHCRYESKKLRHSILRSHLQALKTMLVDGKSAMTVK
jgi:hypothetical protein